jgi:CBS domain-containing protein
MLDLDHIRVGDVMHYGILGCPEDAPLEKVAEIMASRHVHAVAITDAEATRPVGVVSDMDIVAAIAGGNQPLTAQAAATEPITVSSQERLNHAAQLMADRRVTHLVVVDAEGGHPIGLLSTLDLAAVYAHESRWPRSLTDHRSDSGYGRVWPVE